MTKGWWNMHCWNALSAAQQNRLINHGNLPIGYQPEAQGGCTRPAEVAIELPGDKAPGPRFYCRHCAIRRLEADKPRDA
jgi:hypothetical protein